MVRLVFSLLVASLVSLGGSPLFAALHYRASEPEAEPYQPSHGVYAPGPMTDYLALSGVWRLSLGEDNVHNVRVPGCWNIGEGPATLSTTFTIPDGWHERHLRLVLWGARGKLSIKLNGRLVEAWDRDWTTVVVDLPRSLLRLDRKNDLEIEVQDELLPRGTIPLKPKAYDEVVYAGLFGDVALVAGPTAAIEKLQWSSRFAEGYKRADWGLAFTLRNHKPVGQDTLHVRQLSVWASWRSPDGTQAGQSDSVRVNLDVIETSQIELAGSITDPRLWSLEDPHLYEFQLHFREGERRWEVPLRFGLSDIGWQGEQFKLNNNQLEVRGIDMRQETVASGNAVNLEQLRYDLQMVKAKGFNLVRIVGDPPHPATAAITDELGLLLMPGLGLRGVPSSIFNRADFGERLERSLVSLVRRDGLHASVAGWAMLDWASPKPQMLRALESYAKTVAEMDRRPLVISFASDRKLDLPEGMVGIQQRPPYQLYQPIEPMIGGDQSWLVGGLGGFVTRMRAEEDSIRGQVRQADAILLQLKMVRSMPVAGFIIDGYADRRAAWPIMMSGERLDTDYITRGLLTRSRQDRIAWQKVGEAIGQVRIEAPTVESASLEFPIIFPMATMVLLGVLLLFMRQNNVFRQNLKRVYAHTHGFFVDIRDRRYFQSGQTITVALMVSAGHAILAASWLHHSRNDFALDYMLTLLLPFFKVKEFIVRWAWDPIMGIVAFSLLFFFLLILVAMLVRVIGFVLRSTVRFRQAFSLVSWASTHFLMIFPLGWIFYRFLEYEWFRMLALVLLGFFWLWYLVRIAAILRISYRVSHRTAWGVLLLFVLLVGGAWLIVNRNVYALLDYVEYYRIVLLPWVNA